ncbi:hypothetical protein [Streptacidiphilus rugosus]|uniref:hypothetical protein n=1 Tax=Streptacidiphilus rugosus TaxID=405783 RepID=UPI000AE98090|nr:hypothetical protein [Streptacidiphilus rugosus]
MSDTTALAGLGAHPGLCAGCRHRLLNETRRGTVYLRCGLAATDDRLPRYPRLPVGSCVGFEPGATTAGQAAGGDQALT